MKEVKQNLDESGQVQGIVKNSKSKITKNDIEKWQNQSNKIIEDCYKKIPELRFEIKSLDLENLNIAQKFIEQDAEWKFNEIDLINNFLEETIKCIGTKQLKVSEQWLKILNMFLSRVEGFGNQLVHNNCQVTYYQSTNVEKYLKLLNISQEGYSVLTNDKEYQKLWNDIGYHTVKLDQYTMAFNSFQDGLDLDVWEDGMKKIEKNYENGADFRGRLKQDR